MVSWIKRAQKFWKKLITAHAQLQMWNWQLSPHEFSKVRSLIHVLRPEIIGIVIWSKFQLEFALNFFEVIVDLAFGLFSYNHLIVISSS